MAEVNEELRVPPVELLMDGSATTQQFIELGVGFVGELLYKRCRLDPHESVLDLGCGVGQKARVLADYMADDARYEGLDIVPEAIDFCISAYKDKPNFKFLLADIQSSHYNKNGKYKASHYRLPYEDDAFDVVFLASLFTHLLPDEVSNYCREISRVLKKGGRCLATCFLLTEESRSALASAESKAVFRFSGGSDIYRLLNEQNPAQGVAYDEAWLRRVFAESGLRISEMTFGTWDGQPDIFQSLQDIILAVAV